jgi:NAD(P)-dependent dehydrogenase (short-subunit alcohol dehydrogenase family)
MYDLSGKTVLLTGASSGIGATTAKLLGECGAYVIGHYVDDHHGIEEATREISDDHKILLAANFEEPRSARDLWRRSLAWRGRVDVVINNAAIMPETALSGSDEAWDQGWSRALQVNLVEPASLTREAVLHFAAAGGGIIISLSSWAGQQGSAIATLSGYAATKSAIKALTQTIARNYAKEGVLAYVIAPGIVRTSMSLISATARGGDDAVKAILPLGDLVPTSEVAAMVAFLASGQCRHLSGATIDMNGAAYVR